MAEALPFQIRYQGAGPLDSRRVLENTSEGELSSHVQGDPTAFAGQTIWLTDEGAAYVVTDPDAGAWRRYDGPRVVAGVTEGGTPDTTSLASWIQDDAAVYSGERLWLPEESATYVVTDAANGAWRKVGGHRVVESTSQDDLTSHLSQDDSFYDGQVIWLSDESGAYVITDAANGYWRRYDRPRVVPNRVSQSDLSFWIQNDENVYDGAHLWLPAEGNEYVVVDAADGIWRPVLGPRVVGAGVTESGLDHLISDGDLFFDGQLLWVPNENDAYVVTDAASGGWRRLAGRLVITDASEPTLTTWIQDNASVLSDGQIVWLAVEGEAYLIRDVDNARWRRLGGLPVLTGTLETGLASLISGSDRFEDAQRIWLADESSLYVVLDTANGRWRRLAEPTDSRVVVTSQDVTVTAEDEGRLFVIDTFTAENDGYGPPRTLTLPGDAVGEGWEIRVLLDGDMHLEVDPGSNATLAGSGSFVSEMGREVRIVCRTAGTHRVESLCRGLDLQEASTTYGENLDRGYDLEGPVPQIEAVYKQRPGQIWFTRHGSKSTDTRAGSIFVFGTDVNTNNYEITTPTGMPVTLAYHPIANRMVTFDLDARDAVIFDPSPYPDSQPTSSRTGGLSSIASGDTVYPLTSEWVGTSTVVILLLEPSAPELVEFRVDVEAETKSEASTTAIGSVDSTFYREPRRSVVDRQRGYIYLVADAAAYVVDPSDWLTPLVSIDLEQVSNNPDFWNGVYSRVDDRIYLFESGYMDENIEPDSTGGGVSGVIATIDPHRWLLEDTTSLEIEGGESVCYVGLLDCIIGCSGYGNLEVYSPELQQSLQRRADDEVPGAAVHVSWANEVVYINQNSVTGYSY